MQKNKTKAGEIGLPVASADEALCKGCGHPTGVACAAICPTGAIDLRHFKDAQIGSIFEALLVGGANSNHLGALQKEDNMLAKNLIIVSGILCFAFVFVAIPLHAQDVGPITISSFKVDDDLENYGKDKSKGDGDKLAEQGEIIRLPIVLKNNGTATALNVKAILRTNSGLVTISDSTKDYGSINAGQEKDIGTSYPYDGFHFVVSNTAQGGDVVFTLRITTSNGGDFTSSVTVPVKGGGKVGPVEIARFQIDDDTQNYGNDKSNGDGDKVADQGEKIRLPVVLRNSGTAPAFDVKAILRTNSTAVAIVDSVKDYKVIGDGQEKDIGTTSYPYDGFHFTVSTTAPSGDVIFSVKITTSNGGDFTSSVTVPIKGGGIVGPVEVARFQIDDDMQNYGNDKSKGDGDKMAEQGEKIRLPVVLRNSGTAPAFDVKATLRTNSTAVAIVDSAKDYKVIGDGQEKDIGTSSQSYDGFHFVVSNTAPSGDVVFMLKITTSNGGDFTDSVTVSIKGGGVAGPVEVARFQIDDDTQNYGNDKSNGDGDKLAEQGEKIRLPIVLKNLGTAAAFDVKATLSASNPSVMVVDSIKNYGTIGDGQEKDIGTSSQSYDGFHFVVSNTALSGDVVFTLKITTSNGGDFVGSVTVPIKGGGAVGPIEVARFQIDDDTQNYGNDKSNGDGDKVADQGEKIRLPVVLRNSGTAPAFDVKAVLRTNSTAVAIVDSVKDYKVIGDGQEKDIGTTSYSYDGFHFNVSNTAPSGDVIFSVKITTSNGGDFTGSVTVSIKGGGTVGPVEIVRFQIDDDTQNYGNDKSNGDGDKVVEQGEKIRLPVVVRNSGTAPAFDVKAILRTNSTTVTIVDSVKDYKVIGDGQEKDIGTTSYPYDGFHFTVSNTAPSEDVVFTVKITTSNGGTFSDRIILSIGKPSDLTAPVITFASPIAKTKLPPRRFTIKLGFSDGLTGSGIDTTSLQISNSRDIGGISGGRLIKAGENLAKFFRITPDSTQFTIPDSLAFPYGDNTLIASIADNVGNLSKSFSVAFKVDIFGITSPPRTGFAKQSQITVQGFAIAPLVAKVKINQIEVPISNDIFSTQVNLAEGPNRIIGVAYDANNVALRSDTLNLILDTRPPVLSISSPVNGATLSYSPVEVTGTASDANSFRLRVNNQNVKVENGQFKIEMPIDEGANAFTATAVDTAGNTTTKSITVYGRPPSSPAGTLTLYLKDDGQLSKFPFPSYPPNVSGFSMAYVFGSSSWIFPLQGDIRGGTYKVSLLAGCYGLGQAQMRADLILRHQGQSIVLGSTPTFVGTMAGPTPYGYFSPARKNFDVSGTDPASAPGDTLIFKVTKVGGDRVGLIFIKEFGGGSMDHSTIAIPEVITAVDNLDVAALPKVFELSQNFPNPFNPETTIKYQLPKNSEVTLKIYNMLGQLVTTLVDEKQPAGYYTVQWNGKDEHGRPIASGVYLYRLTAGEFVQVQKMLLVR